MKNLLTLISLCVVILTGCVEYAPVSKIDEETTETAISSSARSGDLFFYNFDEKVYLTQNRDKIFLKFAPDATEEQFLAIAKNNTLSQDRRVNSKPHFAKGSDFNTLIIEAPQSEDALTSLKATKEIVSAEYLLEQDGYLSAITNDFLVKVKTGTSLARLQELAKKTGCTVKEQDWFGGGAAFSVTVPESSDSNAIDMANMFYETGLFEWAAPDFVRFDTSYTTDYHYSDQWNLKSYGQYGSSVDIGVEEAWAITKGDSAIKIAVIDSGVDLTHPDLQANLLAGYDATGRGSAGAFEYFTSDDAHGTAVAGIIGAIHNNDGISGIAPRCKIIPIRRGHNGVNRESWAIAALDWARTRADVINCSWGGLLTPGLTTAINNAATQGRGGKGCIVVFAVGNEGQSVLSPTSTLPNVIAVGAASIDGQRKTSSSYDGERWGSNYGTGLDVVAPGVLIPTTDIQGLNGYNSKGFLHGRFSGVLRASDYAFDPDYTVAFGGTSSAAPHVSGIAALILSVSPGLTSQSVRNIITSTASNNGVWNNQTGYGLVDAHTALLKTIDYAISSLHIVGPEEVAGRTNNTYTLEPSKYFFSAYFNGWSVSPTGPQFWAILTDMGHTVIANLSGSSPLTLTATFTLPLTGLTHTVSKTVITHNFSVPIIDWVHEDLPGTNGWDAKVWVINPQTDVDYEWRINNSGSVYSWPAQPTWIYLSQENIGYSDRYIVSCRALWKGSHIAKSDWSNTLVIMAP